MRRATTLGAMIIALLISSAYAIDPNRPGKLAVHIAISDSPNYVEEWVKTPPFHPIVIRRLKQLKIGHTAYVAFIITGHRADERGVPNLEIDCVIRKPDGSVMFQQQSAARVEYRTGEGGFVMADPALDFTVDPGDPLGTWRIEATVRDKLWKTEAQGKSTLDVVN